MPTNERPNILLITSDQQHYSTLGVTNPRLQTPALDRLAAEGTRFDRAYTCNPVCSPARSSIITGLYPAWHHCWTIGVKLPEDTPTVGDVFQEHGYRSILIGKAHFQPLRSEPGSESLECQPILRDLDFWRKFTGPWYGFDHVEVCRNHADESHVGQHYAIWMEEQGLTNWRDYFREYDGRDVPSGRRGAWELPEQYHYTPWAAERTIANMEECVAQGNPFFLFANFMDPHPPYLVPEPWASMYWPEDMEPGRLVPGELDGMPPHFRKTQERKPDFSMYLEKHCNHGFHSHLHDEEQLKRDIATYYGMISFMDQAIGRILEALDRLGIADNTVVAFSTDHGHFLGQHGLIAKGPFHYEDMLRLPMLVRYPGHVPAGAVSSALQSNVDYAPTLLSAAGIEPPGLMQGVNQFDTWCGGAPARAHALVENRHQPTLVDLRTLINDRYKITVYRDAQYGELFDLVEDPGEVHNLWDEPAAAELKSRMLLEFVQAEIQREPTRMPRIAGA
ncbi:MAG: sulfatase-like hydrolase/transferase [Candidatus Hydrogenedentes bacterium]|nr:sulfatase-like hydrolase/transferase [Candidatus Hydrogenedentota bacterium]